GDIKSYGYTLEVQFYALSWNELLNFFEFDYLLYLAFFSVVGIVAISAGFIIWGINRLLTKLRHPPPFHGSFLFYIIAEAPTQGILLALIPCTLTVCMIWAWLGESGFFSSSDVIESPSPVNFEGVSGSWLDNLRLDQGRVDKYRAGRIGVCM
ncbi:unnamed protein product, partial [Chrysoparadoxa australica]